MTDQMSELVLLGWAQLWQVTIVASLVLAMVRVFCRHRPHLAYVLLLVVVVKCLTPPIWSSPVGVFSLRVVSESEQSVAHTTTIKVRGSQATLERNPNVGVLPAVEVQAGNAAAAHADPTSAGEALGIGVYLLFAWACGAGVCAVFVTATWLRHLREIRKTSTPASERLAALSQRVAGKVGLKRRVGLLVSSESYGPSCFGVFFPRVVLPDRLVRQNLKQNLEPILAHELIHIRRGDTWVAFFQILAGIVWWFHPLVWWASRRLSRERERCCDEEAVASIGCDPDEYAQGVLEVLKFKNHPLPAFLASGIRPVEVTKERLESIMSCHIKMHSRTPWLCWLILVLGIVLVVPGQPRLNSLAVGDEVNQDGVIDGLSGRIYLNVTLKTREEGQTEQTVRGIIAVDPNSGEWQKLTDFGHSVRVSRDGHKLVFGKFADNDSREIWTCNADGSGLKKVIAKGYSPVWSSDSTLILANGGKFVEGDKWHHRSWITTPDGSTLVKVGLPDTEGVDDWSPDGQWFVTCSDRHPPHGSGYQLYVIRTDTSASKRLTQGSGLNVYARFSPDGRNVLYCHSEKGVNSVHIVNVTDGEEREIYRGKPDGTAVPDEVCWSPDGTKIGMTLFDWQKDDDGKKFLSASGDANYRIVVVNIDGKSLKEISLKDANLVWAGGPDWGPEPIPNVR